ncbi:hypothetical protein M231_02205 [Tremella mesenterica]|uniref:Uncharacterized protein n=1 Tax=Tremella mesenterica TaxID=5217 RepID=A0A4Q1BRG2_TREME|nr:hypothetical protein M231_02205 [Tremella mesenterica]
MLTLYKLSVEARKQSWVLKDAILPTLLNRYNPTLDRKLRPRTDPLKARRLSFTARELEGTLRPVPIVTYVCPYSGSVSSMETPSLGLPSICAGTDVDTDVNVPWWTFTSIGYPFAFEEPFSHVVEERPAFLDDLRCILPNGTVGKGDDGKSLEAFNRANQSHDPVPDWANGYLQLVSESSSIDFESLDAGHDCEGTVLFILSGDNAQGAKENENVASFSSYVYILFKINFKSLTYRYAPSTISNR